MPPVRTRLFSNSTPVIGSILPVGVGVKTSYLIVKPCSPSGSVHATSTPSTRAPLGPRPHQSTIDRTRSSSPSNAARTVPSPAFATQPDRPSDRARSRVSTRKKTPCTMPRTVTSARFIQPATPWVRPMASPWGVTFFAGGEKSSAVEASLPDERHEPAGDGVDDRRPLGAPNEDLEALSPAAADGNGQAPARLELVVEPLRETGRCRGDGDRRERSLVREPDRAVAEVDAHAVVARFGEVAPRLLRQLRDPLDGVHLAGELGQDRRLVAGAGPDVEHLLGAGQPERLGDASDHVGLGNRLAVPDRQGRVGVRTVPFSLRDEELARDPLHRREHAFVNDVAAAKLVLDHP